MAAESCRYWNGTIIAPKVYWRKHSTCLYYFLILLGMSARLYGGITKKGPVTFPRLFVFQEVVPCYQFSLLLSIEPVAQELHW
jgi:hypothetical protein